MSTNPPRYFPVSKLNYMYVIYFKHNINIHGFGGVSRSAKERQVG
jgi:hypothetical protein